MVDFTASRSRSSASKPRGNTLFLASLCLLGLVAYAFVEPVVNPSGDQASGASLTDRAAS